MMAEKIIRSVSFAGAGNVAHHLAPAFSRAGCKIRHIISRTSGSAAILAAAVNAQAGTDISVFDDSTDLLVIAIPDNSIPEFADALQKTGRFQGVVVHTSGSQPLDVLSKRFAKCGVFYPLQSFSRYSNPMVDEIPVCIEASRPETAGLLKELASRISGDVRDINSDQRAVIHLSAVFASNFTNHMYALATDLLKPTGVAPDILYPLIRETALRLRGQDPAMLQTGPAVRGDQSTIQRHLEMLAKSPEIQEMYKTLSNSIAKLKQR